MDLPDVVPLFPLPNVVHFPGVPLPLHVFEPRYRELVRDALAGRRLVGMVLLRAGWEADYYGAPPVFDVGTAGAIVRAERLADGRWNVVLRGLREFVIEGEEDGRSYRRARVRWWEPAGPPISEALLRRVWALAREYLSLAPRPFALPPEPEAGVHPLTVVNFFAQQLDVAPLERQAVLEALDAVTRATRLAAALELEIEARRRGPGPTTVQ